MGITLKLRKRASERSRQELARTVQDLRLRMEPLFPDTPADDLARVFSLEVPQRQVDRVMQTLATLKAVELVEREPKRRLA
ncbi:MAG: hypothetical protein ACXWC6_08550 [Ramlibacter sp.]